MRNRQFFKSSKIFLQSVRFYSNDPSKTFREKGLAEENRYFIKKQQEEIKLLRKQLQRLENKQQNLQDQLQKANNTLEKFVVPKKEGKK